jgi:hypothetical protein
MGGGRGEGGKGERGEEGLKVVAKRGKGFNYKRGRGMLKGWVCLWQNNECSQDKTEQVGNPYSLSMFPSVT